MESLSAETDVFRKAEGGRAILFSSNRRRSAARSTFDDAVRQVISSTLDELAGEGWRMSLSTMIDDGPHDTEVYRTGFTHDFDFIAAWEAPSLFEAEAAIRRLRDVGWDHLFVSDWQIGPREFAPVPTSGRSAVGCGWAMFAFWEWNDQWHAATPAEVVEYDAECDVAFRSDIGSGVSIAGRYRMDVGSNWDHLALWEVPEVQTLTRAMREHERVADFKFTTSQHYLGRRAAMSDYLESTNV